MKCKVSTGRSFRGLFSYLLAGGRGEVIGGNCAAGNDIKSLSWEFGAVRAQRPEIKKPVWHCSLSLPPGDDLSDEQWQETAAAFLKKMDINDSNQYCIVRHRDKEHQHVHLVINRVGPDGAIWYNDRDIYRAIKAARELEAQTDYLRDTSALDNTNHNYYPSYGEQSRQRKTGQGPARQRVHDTIRRVIAEAPTPLTPKQFIEALAKQGIEARPNIASTGRMNGFSFSGPGGGRYTGSKVGAKWAVISKDLDYVPERDNPYLLNLSGRSPGAAPTFDEAEYSKLRAALDDYARQPFAPADFAKKIKDININQLMHGAKNLQAEHYAELASLAEKTRAVWADLRGTRRPMSMRPQDMMYSALIIGINPILGALILLPFALERLSYAQKQITAQSLSAEYDQLKIQIAEDSARQKTLTEVKTMAKNQDKLVALGNHISRTAKNGGDFARYSDFCDINQLQSMQAAPADLASLYKVEDWRDAVEPKIDLGQIPAESAMIYTLPQLFFRLSQRGDEVSGQALERELIQIADDYYSRPQPPKQEQEQKPEQKLDPGTRIEIDDGRIAEITAPERITDDMIGRAVKMYYDADRQQPDFWEKQKIWDSVFLSASADPQKATKIPKEYQFKDILRGIAARRQKVGQQPEGPHIEIEDWGGEL